MTESQPTDLFIGVTNDEAYAEALTKRELLPKRQELLDTLKRTEKALKDLDEEIKIKTANKLFVSKADFMLTEELDQMDLFLDELGRLMKVADKRSIDNLIRRKRTLVKISRNYIHDDANKVDILYDYHRPDVYNTIKERNAEANTRNERSR